MNRLSSADRKAKIQALIDAARENLDGLKHIPRMKKCGACGFNFPCPQALLLYALDAFDE